MAIGFALFIIDVVLQWRFGRRARAIPGSAGTLEWAIAEAAADLQFRLASRSVAGRYPLTENT